jgi:OTT_1508-like deaminase
MSFLISSNRLFNLTQSHRLRKLTQGKFSVQVLPSPTTTPYYCDLSSETIQVTLDNALGNTSHLSTDQNKERESFIGWLLKQLGDSEVVRQKPTVHAELAMIMAMVRDEIKDVLPYVGVSKLSCIMCNQYIRAFNEVTKHNIATKGSHWKAYPGWFWPSHPHPVRDGELRRAFLEQNRKQLLDDFEEHKKTRMLSDSSVGSGGAGWQIGSWDEIEEMFEELRKES